MSACEQCCWELPEYVADGEPDLPRYQVLRAHLQTCKACRAYALRLRLVEDALRTYPLLSPDPAMALMVMHRIAAQETRGDEEWHLLPWDVSVPALAIALALALVVLSMPSHQPLPVSLPEVGGPLVEWPGAIDAWLAFVRALMSKDIFWAVWSGVFATTAGIGIGLSLANWSTLNRERLARLEDRIADAATWLRGRARRVG